jgi:hypothetical protein
LGFGGGMAQTGGGMGTGGGGQEKWVLYRTSFDILLTAADMNLKK